MNINWYPGHMAKTKRELSELMPVIDIVYELVDARIPYSSKMNNLDILIKNKTKILIMTKKDLCDEKITTKWIKYYENKGYHVLLLNLNDNNDYKKLVNITNQLTASFNKKREAKGLKRKEIKALVIGIPNVGKSTLINRMAGKKVAVVGNNPGVTKNNTWLKTKYNILLLDTPGILEPKIEDPIVGLNLASMSAIKIDVLPIDDVAYHILDYLNKYYPTILNKRYGITSYSDDVDTNYILIAKKFGIKINKDMIDYQVISKFIINDIKSEYVKNITFDRGI